MAWTIDIRASPKMSTEVTALINSDLYRYFGRTDRSTFVSTFLKIPGFRYSYFLRKTRSNRDRTGILSKLAFAYYKVLLNHYRFRYGFEIHETTNIGPGLYLGHFGGVVIHPDAVIGNNVNIAQGVTIGQTSRGRKAGVPVIGERVWIGANAIVVGAVSIGSDCLIGPGAYVNFDMPPGAVVIGNPGKIVSYSGSAGYVERTVAQPMANEGQKGGLA
jgi:serine O-acetyltransferase